MTLVAGFRLHGLPVLIGDVLITNQITRERATIRRKLLHLRKNLVLGWAGSAKGASILVRRLNDQLSVRPPALAVHSALSQGVQWITADLLPVQVAGWIVEDQRPPSTFRWDSSDPEKVERGDYAVIGSGTLLFQSRLSATRPPEEWNEEHAVITLAFLLGRLMGEEIMYDGVWEKTLQFGVAFDVLVFRHGKFEPYGPLVYTGTKVQLDDRFEIAAPPKPKSFLLHRNVGPITVYQTLMPTGYVINMVDPIIDVDGGKTLRRIMKIVRARLGTQIPYVFDGKVLIILLHFYAANGRLLTPVVFGIPRSRWIGCNTKGIGLGNAMWGTMIEKALQQLKADFFSPKCERTP